MNQADHFGPPDFLLLFYVVPDLGEISFHRFRVFVVYDSEKFFQLVPDLAYLVVCIGVE